MSTDSTVTQPESGSLRAASRATIICVTGMHRSGTSVATKMVNVLGAYIGPEERLVPAAFDNPKGFWEHEPIVRLNDEILARLGGRAMAPPDMPEHWHTTAALEDLRVRAESIASAFPHNATWAWKDPRACLTLPFWQSVLPPMKYLVCVRNPLDVARSLERRNRISFERSVYLWLIYTLSVLKHTSGEIRHVVMYDRLLDEPSGELENLAALLGGDALLVAAQPSTADAVASFIDPELRHHRASRGPSKARTAEQPHSAIDFAMHAYELLETGDNSLIPAAESFLRSGLDAVGPSETWKSGLAKRALDEGSLVSIIINNYNYARFLGDAIESALGQSYSPVEVVVVDDGSNDESRAVIESYGTRVRAVFKENGGQASAFNAGFYASKGEAVIFLDADDALLPDAVEKAVSSFSPGVVKVHAPMLEIDASGRRTGGLQPGRPLGEGNLRQRSIIEGPVAGNSPPTSGNVWSRDLLERVFPVPEAEFRINADGYLLTLAWIYGEVRALPHPLALYRVHGNNNFASGSPEQRAQLHLEKFEHNCDALELHLRAMGVEPSPGVWRQMKKQYMLRSHGGLKKELETVLPGGADFILVDEDALNAGIESAAAGTGRAIPFLERDGKYWGKPADDALAIAEIERLRCEGAGFIVFVWFTFWWLDYYQEFGNYIRERFSPVRSDENLLVFDLRQHKASNITAIATI